MSAAVHSAHLDTAFTLDADRAFGGMARLYGEGAARRMRSAHVAVVGVGGVGSWCAEALARSGVGRLTLIDLDHIAESNINRQIHALCSTVGQSKILAMKARIADINPACEVLCVEDFVDPGNSGRLLSGELTAVVDACDQAAAKLAMAADVLQGKFSDRLHVVVGAAGGKRAATGLMVADLPAVTHDPLLARLRSDLRRQLPSLRERKSWGMPCVFSREPIVASQLAACDVQSDQSLNCHGFGSAMHVTAAFGLAAAGEVLRQLAYVVR